MPQSSLYVDTGWTDHNVYSVNNQTMEDTFSERRAEMTREIWLVGTTRLRLGILLDILRILRMEQLTAYYLNLVGVSIHKRARCLHHLIPRPDPSVTFFLHIFLPTALTVLFIILYPILPSRGDR
jgi:hypothetical protein